MALVRLQRKRMGLGYAWTPLDLNQSCPLRSSFSKSRHCNREEGAKMMDSLPTLPRSFLLGMPSSHSARRERQAHHPKCRVCFAKSDVVFSLTASGARNAAKGLRQRKFLLIYLGWTSARHAGESSAVFRSKKLRLCRDAKSRTQATDSACA